MHEGNGPAEPTRPVRPRVGPVPWLIGGGVAVLGLIGTVIGLNLTLYSPSGFVDRYLSAIDRRDLASALEMPGVEVPTGASTDLLTRQGTVPVDSARVVDTVETGGVTSVRVEWADQGRTGVLDLAVEPAPPTLGLFNGWRFATSPLAAVPISVSGSPEVRANGVALEARSAGDGVASVTAAALAPSRLTLDLDTRLVAAAPVTTVAGSGDAPATVEGQATPEFIDSVQRELNAFLDQCATQQVLQPAGCPFGTFLQDRLVAPPTWAMVDYPQVSLRPQPTVGTWAMPSTPGSARITGEVLSLFDGSRSDLDETVPFTVRYDIEIDADGNVRIG